MQKSTYHVIPCDLDLNDAETSEKQILIACGIVDIHRESQVFIDIYIARRLSSFLQALYFINSIFVICSGQVRRVSKNHFSSKEIISFFSHQLLSIAVCFQSSNLSTCSLSVRRIFHRLLDIKLLCKFKITFDSKTIQKVSQFDLLQFNRLISITLFIE